VICIRTAISGLSARVDICSGEGSRLRRGGGDISTRGTASDLGTFEKNLRIPSFFFNCRSISSSDGADDKSEESDIFWLWLLS
jgi:hypothetical protein